MLGQVSQTGVEAVVGGVRSGAVHSVGDAGGRLRALLRFSWVRVPKYLSTVLLTALRGYAYPCYPLGAIRGVAGLCSVVPLARSDLDAIGPSASKCGRCGRGRWVPGHRSVFSVLCPSWLLPFRCVLSHVVDHFPKLILARRSDWNPCLLSGAWQTLRGYRD